ncbi:DUF4276 family protein [Limnospira fusiformis KN01]|uniref:DUF4276 family protein n=1 Tax=Limnospira TaxID=2596745 RepID=UPI000280409D|nr:MULTISPECIES: DUF4276 family protein [Limnospira]EKD08279.1 hypothetical protein SPLC1_S260510 [Arthrospira platensis C1]MDY7052898.1 DUF4276 family protein [Limnospira fusiformis LS22]QJB25123.1 DUF4276 family protein [Limnospira fusiformis SAG 85.79]MDT9186877.1 DUF4276 family protein [Limnospira sp. PMC 894.15]MDT9197518.1 DUF4276 family protein [Limnospira sp. PMC 1042.18]
MVKEIRIYIEGGGDSKNTKARLRSSFNQCFRDLVKKVRVRRIKWNIIICGSRNNAYECFTKALVDHPNCCNILLVDSEAPVTNNNPWQHLRNRDHWNDAQVSDRYCHLMVQAMEAWFIADIDALIKFYGNGFRKNLIPENSNVEIIAKDRLPTILNEATRHTQKGKYQKIAHGCQL